MGEFLARLCRACAACALFNIQLSKISERFEGSREFRYEARSAAVDEGDVDRRVRAIFRFEANGEKIGASGAGGDGYFGD